MSKYDAFLVVLTSDQQDEIRRTTNSVGPGEAVIAQVYFDGLRVKLLNADQVKAIQAIMGVDYSDEFSSAFDAIHHGVRRFIQ
jgi:hypothetical protein